MKDVYNTVHILWTLCPHAIYPNIIIALYMYSRYFRNKDKCHHGAFFLNGCIILNKLFQENYENSLQELEKLCYEIFIP